MEFYVGQIIDDDEIITNLNKYQGLVFKILNGHYIGDYIMVTFNKKDEDGPIIQGVTIVSNVSSEIGEMWYGFSGIEKVEIIRVNKIK